VSDRRRLADAVHCVSAALADVGFSRSTSLQVTISFLVAKS